MKYSQEMLAFSKVILRKRDSWKNDSTRFDDNEAYFLAEELTKTKAELLRTVFGPKKALQFVPEEREPTPPGVEEIKHRLFEVFGVAEIVANYGEDLPLIEMALDEFTRPLVTIGCAYAVSIQDLWAADHTGFALLQEKAEGCRDANMRKTDEVYAVGVPSMDLPGLLNDPDVQTIVLPVGDWLNVSTTNDEILDDLLFFEERIILNSGENYFPNTLLIPAEVRKKLVRPREVATDTSVLSFFQERSWGADTQNVKWKIDTWDLLKGAGVGGVDRIVMYKADNEILEGSLPIPHQELEPEIRNLLTKTSCIARVGGTLVKRPLGIAYSDNALS